MNSGSDRRSRGRDTVGSGSGPAGSEDKPLVEGFLLKRGRLNTAWKLRYCRLFSSGELAYCEVDASRVRRVLTEQGYSSAWAQQLEQQPWWHRLFGLKPKPRPAPRSPQNDDDDAAGPMKVVPSRLDPRVATMLMVDVSRGPERGRIVLRSGRLQGVEIDAVAVVSNLAAVLRTVCAMRRQADRMTRGVGAAAQRQTAPGRSTLRTMDNDEQDANSVDSDSTEDAPVDPAAADEPLEQARAGWFLRRGLSHRAFDVEPTRPCVESTEEDVAYHISLATTDRMTSNRIWHFAADSPRAAMDWVLHSWRFQLERMEGWSRRLAPVSQRAIRESPHNI